jgi:hypothetical protein
MKRLALLSALACCVVTAAFAADFWVSKPPAKWSMADAARVLTDSPWAHTLTVRVSVLGQQTRRNRDTAVAETQSEPVINYVVCLRSAKPVRAARVRMIALDQKYDKMDAAAKAAFDAKWKEYVEREFPDTMVVAIGYASNVPEKQQQLTTYFQKLTLETAKQEIWISLPDGQKLEPVAFEAGQPGSREFQMAFARPAALPANAALTIEFKHPDVLQAPSQRLTATFPLKSLTFEGVASY